MDKHIFIVFFVLFYGKIVLSFNLDIREPIVMDSGFPGEYFGFTVALHSHGSDKWVLVGAPLANQTAPFGSRFSIHERYGAVYKCRPSKGSKCESVPIDVTDSPSMEHNDEPIDLEEKSGQWLGATLHSTGKDGKVVACAPRYTLRGTFISHPEKRPRLLLGRCFLVRDNLVGQYKTVSPCHHGENARILNYGYGYDGYCQAGFGASLTKDGQMLALSATGKNYGRGNIGAYFKESGKTIFVQRSELKSEKWGDGIGYAVTTGNFKSGINEQIVGTSPRARNLKGKVMAFEVIGQEKIKVSFTLPLPKDAQIGSYFGHSVCSVDLDNDGMSDLLVGAPRYSYDRDEGRVYVYLNNGLDQKPKKNVASGCIYHFKLNCKGALNLMDNMILNGDRRIDGNFGFTIASAGDLNKDGFNDVVIGAPYAGDDGRGAVYIYHGSSHGIDTNYRQKITASMLSDQGIKTFGYSLSGDLDVDNNNYPDIAVGAFASDKAVLLRTRPIVEVKGKIKLSQNQIVLEDNTTSMCDNGDGIRRKCLTVEVCLQYNYKVPSNQGVNLKYSLELDQVMQIDFLRRMFFLNENKTDQVFSVSGKMSLTQDTPWMCHPAYQVYLRKENRINDGLSPLTFDLKYDLEDHAGCTVCPILDDYDDDRRRTVRETAQFVKQCGKDQQCVPDMTVKGKVLFPGGYKDLPIGITSEMRVSIDVGNKADDFAYPGKVIVTYPSLLGYIGAEAKQGVQCNRMDRGEETEKAVCIVGMPFKGRTQKSFDLTFTTSEVKGNISEFYIELFATSPSRDADWSDNKVKLQVNVKFEADMSITGSSVPDEVVYGNKIIPLLNMKKEEDIGPLISQNIIVRNEGPSAVDGSVVTISIPWKHDKEDQHSYLLYLMSVRVRGSAASCDVITNPLNIKTGNKTKGNSGPSGVESTTTFADDQRGKRDNELGISCNAEECLQFTCRLGRLKKGDDVEILMTSRLWQNTLIKADAGGIDLVTMAKVAPPSSISEPINGKGNQIELFLRANPKVTKTPPETTPIWIIIVSALAGLLLLGLLIFILSRFGFFKRKRAKDLANEEEKMTSNGRYEAAADGDSPQLSHR